MVVRQGKYGPFLACNRFPACTSKRSVKPGMFQGMTTVKVPGWYSSESRSSSPTGSSGATTATSKSRTGSDVGS